MRIVAPRRRAEFPRLHPDRAYYRGNSKSILESGILVSVSRENVDTVRRIYGAVARRDETAPFEVYAEDIIWDVSNMGFRASLIEKPVYHGHEGVRQFWREWLSAFGEIDLDVEDLVDAGDKVLAVISERQVGRASGVPVEATHLAVWTLIEGKVIRLETFVDRSAAEQAAGLSD